MPHDREAKPFKRLIKVIVIDLAVLGVLLVAFAYFHHVRVDEVAPTTLSSVTPRPNPTPTVEPADAPPLTGEETPAQTSTPEIVDTGLLGGLYTDKFTGGEVEQTETSYRSGNVCVEIQKVMLEAPRLAVYYVADIYIKDVTSFRSAVALDYKEHNEGARKNVMDATQLSSLVNAIVAVDGDNFTFRKQALIAIRDGKEYIKSTPVDGDVCALFYDGTMETYLKKEMTSAKIAELYARSPYQVWTFGPELLEDGQVKTVFGTSKTNPLCAIGYYAPGHYCFILADGRQNGYSLGITLPELSQIFYDLGCTVAYNLDGGDTAVMTFMGEWMSHPENEAPRQTGDILYIAEPAPIE